MATNPYVNKVTYSGTTLIDLTSDTVEAGKMLAPYTAHDKSGAPIVGEIESLSAGTINTSSTDQTIAAGQYLSGAQTIKAVTTSGLNVGNVRYGATVKVGDVNDDDRIASIEGTFSAASTVSSGQTAAGAGQIVAGYSAFMNGAELQGTIASKGSADMTASGATVTAPAGYYPEASSKSVAAGSATVSGTITVTPTINVLAQSGIVQATVGQLASITPSVTAGYISSGTTGQMILTGSKSVTLTSSSVTEGTTTVSGTTATRGTATYGTGWIQSGEMAAAEFANTATSGKTYVDISNTAEAPVLVTGDYLYINKGYTDDLKISLAKLVPDAASADLSSSVILSGYSAYDNAGNLIAGNIPTKTSADMTVSGATVTAPSGYYASAQSKTVASGTEGTPTATKGSVSLHSISVTPSVTNTAGYIAGGTKTGTAVTVTASELVSGTYSVTESGTADVTNYATVSVGAGSATTPSDNITANPTVTINSTTGVVTATVAAASAYKSITPTVSAGWVASGTAGTVTASGTGTLALTTLAATTYTPTTSAQTITAGKYLTGAQTIAGDANLVAGNIKSGVSIFGVSGTYAGQSVTYTETDNTSGGYTVDIVVTG